MNYYERHIGDYLRDTAHLSLLRHGIYTRLLDVYYTREAGLPDVDVLRLIGARTKEEKAAGQKVLAEFFQLVDGFWVQRRCDAEIARFHDKQRKAKASAKASWESRRAEPSQCERNANAMRTHSEGNAPSNQTPDTSLQKEREPTALVPAASPRVPPAPSAEVVELYRKHLPQLPGVEVLSDSRKRAIAVRWREVCSAEKFDKAKGLEWFAWFFGHVANSSFLTGHGSPDKSGRVWRADLDWLMNPSNFARVIEGRYHNERARG